MGKCFLTSAVEQYNYKMVNVKSNSNLRGLAGLEVRYPLIQFLAGMESQIRFFFLKKTCALHFLTYDTSLPAYLCTHKVHLNYTLCT